MQAINQEGTPLPQPRFLAWLARIEEIILSSLLVVMIALACYQIALRWFTSGGLLWIDPLLRYLVLWSGLLGAVLATAKSNHIALDILSYLVGDQVKVWLKVVANFFSTIVSFFLLKATLLFIRSEMEFGGNGLFQLPNWLWNMIFPIAFFLICLHFAGTTLFYISQLVAGRSRGE